MPNIAGVLVSFLSVDLAKSMEESGVDAFVADGVGATNGVVVDLDNIMVPERSFRVCNWRDFDDLVTGMRFVKISWVMRQITGYLLDVVLKLKFEKVKRDRNRDICVVMRSTVIYSVITVGYSCVVVVLFAGSVGSHNLLG